MLTLAHGLQQDCLVAYFWAVHEVSTVHFSDCLLVKRQKFYVKIAHIQNVSMGVKALAVWCDAVHDTDARGHEEHFFFSRL